MTPSMSPPMPAELRRIPALSLRDVRKSYPGTPPVESVRGVTLDVMPGELASIVGPSGSGKTTLLHLAAGLDRPTGRLGGDRPGQQVSALSDREAHAACAHGESASSSSRSFCSTR